MEEEYTRFAAKRTVAWKDRSKIMRTNLEKPYNFICELFKKSVACHIGGLGQISDTKLFAVTAIVNSLTGSKFNWSKWFVGNIQDAARDFEYEQGSNVNIMRRGKLRLFGKLSYALEQLFPNRNWTGTIPCKKQTVLYDLVKPGKPLVDRGILNKDVRSAEVIPAVRKGKKRATSPAKKKKAAPAKKTKRVASPAQPSEGEASSSGTSMGVSALHSSTKDEEARSSEGDEVNQPQTSTINPSQPQPTQTPQPQASEPQFLPQSAHPKNTQGIFVHRGVVFEDEESVSTHVLPDLPLLNPDPTAAYQIYKPSHPTQAPIQTTISESPTNTLDTNLPSQSAIQTPLISPTNKAI